MASQRGRLAVVRRLLRHGRHGVVDQHNQCGETPLLIACRDGHKAVAQLLLEHGATVDATVDVAAPWSRYGATAVGITPLLVACQNGHEGVVRLLLGHGAAIDHATVETVLFPYAPSLVCAEAEALLRAALAPWSPRTHHVQTAAFRRGVFAVLCVGLRLRSESDRRRSGCWRCGGIASAPIPLLPPEVWLHVLRHCESANAIGGEPERGRQCSHGPPLTPGDGVVPPPPSHVLLKVSRTRLDRARFSF